MSDKPIYTLTYKPAGNQPQHQATFSTRMGQSVVLRAGETSKPRFMREGEPETWSNTPGIVCEKYEPPKPKAEAKKPATAKTRKGKS